MRHSILRFVVAYKTTDLSTISLQFWLYGYLYSNVVGRRFSTRAHLYEFENNTGDIQLRQDAKFKTRFIVIKFTFILLGTVIIYFQIQTTL